MSTPAAEHGPGAAVATAGRVAPQQQALLYAGALQQAGGQPLELLAQGGDQGALCVGLYRAPPYDLDVPALGVSRLSITLTAARVSGGLEGERHRPYQAGRHALFLTPAGVAARWRKESPSRHLTIYFRADALPGEVPAAGHGDGLAAPLLNARLPGTPWLIDALADELGQAGLLAEEAADALARLLLVRLARQQARRGTRAATLTPAALARLREFAEAHLAERILVADLAAVLGMPPNRLAQVFVRCTGQSPHQFLLSLRLQRAQGLLAHSTLGLAEVAAACGFASQQHLTHTMRKQLGTTPARWRNAQR